MEEGRKGREAVRATGTGGREPRGGGATHLARQSPPVWLAKAEGPDCMSSHSQRDLTSGILKVNSSVLREWGRARGHQEGELLSPGRQSSAQQGTKVLASTITLSHPPARVPKGMNSQNLLAPRKHPMLCFCRSIPPMCLPPSWCYRSPPAGDHQMAKQQTELSLPLLLLCTLLIHPG